MTRHKAHPTAVQALEVWSVIKASPVVLFGASSRPLLLCCLAPSILPEAQEVTVAVDDATGQQHKCLGRGHGIMVGKPG